MNVRPALPTRSQPRLHRAIAAFLLAIVLVCGALGSALAQLGDAPRSGRSIAKGAGWDSLDGFLELARAQLGDARVIVTQRLDYATLSRDDALVLVHPVGDLDLASLSRFLHDGGRLILLDDFGDGDLLLAHFGMARKPLVGASQTMGNTPYLPVAKPSSYHQTVANVDEVVLNHASCIDHPDLSSVLEVEVRSGEKKAVAVAGAVGQGHLLVVSDASVFVDAMLRFPGNAAFARAVVQYAIDDDVWGRRAGRLFVIADEVEQVGVFGNASPLSAFLEEAQRSAREALQKLGQEGLAGAPALGVSILAAFACVMWVARRAAKAHAPQLPRFLQPVGVLAGGGNPAHVQTLLAKSTPRALALLEHKAAFEDKLAVWLGLPEPVRSANGLRNPLPPQDELFAMLRARGVGAAQLTELRQLFFRLAQAETWLLSRGRAPRVSEAEVVSISERLDALLRALPHS